VAYLREHAARTIFRRKKMDQLTDELEKANRVLGSIFAGQIAELEKSHSFHKGLAEHHAAIAGHHDGLAKTHADRAESLKTQIDAMKVQASEWGETVAKP
jgi:hypothetical protein